MVLPHPPSAAPVFDRYPVLLVQSQVVQVRDDAGARDSQPGLHHFQPGLEKRNISAKLVDGVSADQCPVGRF
jgi:hypothetical protein